MATTKCIFCVTGYSRMRKKSTHQAQLVETMLKSCHLFNVISTSCAFCYLPLQKELYLYRRLTDAFLPWRLLVSEVKKADTGEGADQEDDVKPPVIEVKLEVAQYLSYDGPVL